MIQSATCSCCCGGDSGLQPQELELLEKLDDELKPFLDAPGGLIPALQKTQKQFGYLPKQALTKIAALFNKPYSQVAGVVSFYSFFSTVPRGKYLVRVCLGTACYVRGGKEVLESLKKELELDVGETTPDRLFSLEVGRCFGACGLAPVVMINDDVHQRVRPSKVATMLAQYKDG